VAATARAHDAPSQEQSVEQRGPPIARTGFRRWFRRLGLVLLVLLWVPVAPAALGETAVTDISVSATVVDFGETVTVSGSVSEGPGCTGGRPITLQWRAADSSGFAAVATGTTGGNGSFAFQQSQPHTGRYRATLEEQGECAASVSDVALVRVRALVDAAIVAGSTEAGECVVLAASVDPSRAGQEVELQRKIGGAWTLTERLTLDASSEAFVEPCLSFDDIGIVRLRVRWVAQDALNETNSSPVLAVQVTEAPWMDAIEDAIGSRAVSVAVGDEDAFLYRRAGAAPRIPASNEKLLLSMVMLDTFGASFRIRTSAAATTVKDSGVVDDLWILGRGDPRVNSASLAALAREIAEAGITRVRGRVIGSTAYFRHDWDAVGWDGDARDYVNRPTALTFDGNDVAAPERRAAEVLTNKLEHLGVRVGGAPGSGAPPPGLETVASIESRSLGYLLTKMLRPSDNFSAETLGKRLGVQTRGVPGTIAKGAASIQGWTNDHGASFTLHDNSGLSYANRVTAQGLVSLLWAAEDAAWGRDLRRALPTGGQGTLRDRLHGVEVRAKTGTLTDVSALSGWIFATDLQGWVEFSILCHGMSKSVASEIEDEIVRVLEVEL
jgi:serine-type D-Ala-D-Ala carboxypeptidase/endopeptidase (penicillin-binding protein 4)